MKQLLSNYSVGQIIFFIVILALAIKQLVTFIDWFQNRTKSAVKEKEKPDQLACITEQHGQQLQKIRGQLNDLKDDIELLIASDRDDIKQSLTKDHHYFCYKLKSIDDYSLDCMEKRYSHYREQGGNSFVQTLMQEVRALPKRIEMENR